MSQLANSMTKLGRRGEDAEAHAHTQSGRTVVTNSFSS